MELLQRSLLAAVWILIIVGARRLLIHKISAKVFVILWEVVLLRLVFPLAVPFRWSYFGAELGWKYPILREVDLIRAQISYFNELAEKTLNDYLWIMYIWLIGMCILFIGFQLSYWKIHRLLREAVPIQEPGVKQWQMTGRFTGKVKILVSDRVKTPLAYGIFRPRIILPKTHLLIESQQLHYILIHELVHIKRHDNLKKYVVLVILCIHWFNPLVWLLCVLMNRDIERACDRKVVEVIGMFEKKDYALTLVAWAEQNFSIVVPCSNFGEMSVKERIISIMNYQKSTVGAIMVSVLLVLFSGNIFAVPWVEDVYMEDNSNMIETMKTFGNEEQYMILTEDIRVDGKLVMSVGYYELVNIVGIQQYAYVPVDPMTLKRLPNDSLKDGDRMKIGDEYYKIHVNNGNYFAIREGEK